MTRAVLTIPVLKTARLVLEPLAMNHSPGMFEMWRNEAVQEFSGAAEDEHRDEIRLPARSHHESDRLIRFWLKAAADGWGFRWAMLLKDSDVFVGHVGFNSLSEWSEIAYHMNPKYWGKGIMSEAAAAAVAWRRSQGATGIVAFIEPENTRSIALAQRLGMRATGEFNEGARRFELSL